jgi:hypothetical protein
MELECELDDDTEVAAAAAQRPEELRVLARRCRYDRSVRRDDRGGDEVVERQPVHPEQVADTAAERQAGDAGISERAAGRGESGPLAGRVEVLPQRAATADRYPRLTIDAYFAHQAQVDDDATVPDTQTGDTMSTAAHRHGQLCLASEFDRSDHIGDVEWSRDHGRVAVDNGVEGRPRRLVCDVLGCDNRPPMAHAKIGERSAGFDGHRGS